MAAKAIAVRRLLINPRFKLDQTPEGVAALFELGKSYERLGIFEQAASYYAKFADREPQSPHARPALEQAVMYHLLLGQTAEGNAAAARFRKRYPNAALGMPDLSPVTPTAGPKPKMLKGEQILPPLLLDVDASSKP
jgi:hypothetical protein